MPVKDPFLAGVLAAVPETDRGKAEARLIELEEGGLRQADYSKLSAEAQTAKKQFDDLYAKNTEWFQTRQKDLAELDTLRSKVTELEGREPLVTPGVVKLPEDVVTTKKLTEILDQTERGAVGFIAEANALTMKHYKEFGEILSINDLLTDPRVQKIGLQAVYQDKFKEQIAAKTKAAADAQAEAFREEGRKAERERLAGQRHPYPVVGNEASVLDGIEASRDGKPPTVRTVDDMAAELARLSAVRMGGGATT